MLQNFVDDKSTLVKVMAWLGAIQHQTITWANDEPDVLLYGVTRPQWVNGGLNYCNGTSDVDLDLLTLTLNFCSSCLVMVSALAMTGMMLTLLSRAFMVTRSRAFNLE